MVISKNQAGVNHGRKKPSDLIAVFDFSFYTNLKSKVTFWTLSMQKEVQITQNTLQKGDNSCKDYEKYIDI